MSACTHMCLYMYMYISHLLLHPFICCWILRLLLYLGNCKQCKYKCCIHVFFQINIFIFSDTYPAMELLEQMVVLFLIF